MPSVIAITLIVVSASFLRAEIAIDLRKCKEQVVAKCQCGEGGDLTDVYVEGCQAVANGSWPCQPCPGSCRIFLNCQICSKHDCISCPIGKTGPTCESNELLQTHNDTISENNQTILITNATEIPYLDTTIAKVSNANLNGTLPKIIIFDVSQIANSSFEPAAETYRPEIKLDLIEFDTRNTSINEVIPDEKFHIFENISTNNAENLPDLSEICTSNCSNIKTNETTNQNSISLIDGHIDNNSNNEIGTFRLDDKIEFGNPQWNESMNTSSESIEIENESQRKKFQDFDDIIEFSQVNIPLNTSNDWVKDYASYSEGDANKQLLKHRSPNPSPAEANTIVVSSSENNDKENLQYEQDQQVLDSSENDYPGEPLISDTQNTIEDIKNPTGPNLKRSILKSDNNTSTETKYVYLSTYDLQNDENESKEPEIVKEAFLPSEQDTETAVKLNEADEIEPIQSQPDQKYDFSKPHLLKQYVDSKEDEDPKSETNVPDLWKNLCTFFPTTSVCRSHLSTADDRNTLHPRPDLHSHIEHTSSYFRSPDYPGYKLLFPNVKDLPTNEPVDLIKHRSMDNSDTIQQRNENLFERLDNIHRPIPQSVGVYGQQTQPSQAHYFNQGYPLNQSPVPSKNIDINSGMNFQKSLFPSLFDHLLHLIGPHIPPYEDGAYSGEKHVYGSPGIDQGPQKPLTMYQSLNSFPQSPHQAHGPPNLFGDYNFRSLNNADPFRPFNFQEADSNYLFSSGQGKIPVVKGQILIANVGNENGTSHVIPGSIRSRNFEFEIPMLMPFHVHHPIHSGKKSSRNSKTERPKHGKSAKRLKKFHKRRRNGVKEDASSNVKKCNPWKEDCTKDNGNLENIDPYNSSSGRKIKHTDSSNTWRKGGNIPDRIHMKYIKTHNSESTASSETITSSKSSAPDNNTAQLQANESFMQPQEENIAKGSGTIANEIVQASDQSSSDSGSNRPLFRVRRSTSHFCPIPKESRNGDLDCTIWSYKKTCKLTCHSGYTSTHQQFTCTRSKNIWTPPMAPCTGDPEFETDENTIQIKHLEELPKILDDEEEEGNKSHDHEEVSREDYDQPVEHSVENDTEDYEAETQTTTTKKPHPKEHEAKKKTKKKAHINSIKTHEDSHVEAEHTHKSKEHEIGHKSHTKSEKPKHHKGKKTEIKEELHPKEVEEEENAVIPKTSDYSEEEPKETSVKHSEEDAQKDEADEKPEDEEVEQDEVDAEYDESDKKKK